MSTLKHQLQRPVIIIALVIIVIAALGVGFRNPLDRQLRAWKLLPEPERLTELYFTQPNTLPTRYTPGQQQTVSFTVHNLEFRPMVYNYQIIEQNRDTNQQQIVANSSFSLAQNAYKHQSVIIPTADIGQNVKVEVRLVNVHESIDYLLERRGA